jgi:RnfABCDGE-type electron transport complex G subunit
MFLAAHFCGGGLVLGAFFMATDPVTSPMTRTGQLIYGALIGGLAALFRFYSGMADGMSYAIIISNLIVPLLDKYIIPVPWGVGAKGQVYNPDEKKKGFAVPKSAVILMVITAIAGAALAGVYAMTKTTIDANQEAKKLQAYAEVVPGGETFEYDETISAAIEGFGGAVYGDGAFGKAYINEVAVAKDASGNVVGYGISATTMDGYDGEISMAVGMDTDGKILGVSFTVLNETAGMGMLVNEESWRGQFQDKQVDSFVLLKQGGSTADNEIDSVSGASTTSGAVVNAVNAAIDFYKNYLAQ